MRENSDYYICVVCKEVESCGLVCDECSREEKEKQRNANGSITRKQLGYIEHLLDKANCDYEEKLYELTTKSAGKLIADLVGWIEDGHEQPSGIKPHEVEMCSKCGVVPVDRYHDYCKSCYDEVFYNGVPRVQCSAINKNGNRCARVGRYSDNYCPTHKNASQQSVHLTDGSLRDLQAFSTLEQNPAPEKLSSPPIGR